MSKLQKDAMKTAKFYECSASSGSKVGALRRVRRRLIKKINK